MGPAGDVEVFDGTAWRPVSSLLEDPAMSNREEPEAARADERADGDQPDSEGSAAGSPDEPEQL